MSDASTIQSGDILDLAIEKLVYGGDGFTHYGSQACFVKEVIPGERVLASVAAVKPQYLTLIPRSILIPSPYRVNPACPVARECGGCQWQHIAYDHQLYWKQQMVQECLARIAGLKDCPVKPALASAAFRYRCKATLKAKNSGKPIVGYFRQHSHDILPVDTCPILTEGLNDILSKLAEPIEKTFKKYTSTLDVLLLFIKQSGNVMLSLKGDKKTSAIKRVLFDAKSGGFFPCAEAPLESINGMLFKRDTESFYQVNYDQNLKMIELVVTYLQESCRGRILDLYCGAGNFSLFFAQRGAEVTGVESNGFAVQEAIDNCRLNNIQDCRFIQGDVNRAGTAVLKKGFDAVLLNPPRGGCGRSIITSIAEEKPDVVVYVSCNPATLARDIKPLVASGYTVSEVQPVDMFPQTYHIETVTKLVR